MRMFLATILAAAAVAATTDPATNVTASTATLNGTVTDASMAYFEWGTTTAYGERTASKPVTDDKVQDSLAGLSPDTTYHYRVVADEATDTPGQDVTFRTAGPPAISNQLSSDVTPTSATVTASVNTKGIDTAYRIQWGASTSFGNLTPTVTSKDGVVTASVTLTDLRPSTTYYWRTRASNAAGSTVGARRTFKTGPLATAVSINATQRRVTWGTGTTIGGRVSGSGVGGLTVALERQQDTGFVEVGTARTGNDGGYVFQVDRVWSSTRFRVVTRTQVPATSPAILIRSKVKVGARARHTSRRWARIEGSILPAVQATVTLQRRRPGGWQRAKRRVVAPTDGVRTRYSFAVPRARKASKRFRVLVQPVRGSGQARGFSRAVVVRNR